MGDETYDTLILSDVHLGSELSRAQDALDVLQSHRFRRLVLLGDIFADLNFRRLTSEHWKFLTHIRKLSNPKRRVEVVWVEGNHDHGLANLMSHLVGVPVYQRYVWEYDGKRHLAVHGHQFDRFVSKNLLISRVGEHLFNQIQNLDTQTKCFSRFLDRVSTRWLRLSDKVADGAIRYARSGQCQRVFCGHTHAALSVVRDGIEYYNSGSWVDARATFLTINQQGVEVQTMPAELTIVVPAKNESQALPRLLKSLSRQDYPHLGDTKVFVADAGSTDCTAAIAELCAARLGLQLQVIPGGLPAVGRNAGAHRATTAYVLFLDADVELVDRTLLRRAMATMQRRGLYCLTTDIHCMAGGHRDRLLLNFNNCVQRLSRWGAPFATGMFMLFDKREFERLGGFNERALYAEDYLLSKQVARRRFAVIAGGVLTSNRRFQKTGHSRIAWMFLKTALNSRNMKYFLRDHGYWENTAATDA